MYQTGRAGDEAKKRKSPAKSRRGVRASTKVCFAPILQLLHKNSCQFNSKCYSWVGLIHTNNDKTSITFLSLCICRTSTFQSFQYAGCLSHEPSLMALAPTILLQLSGRASKLVIGRP